MQLKWILALLGFVYLGFRGAIGGFIIGAIIDSLYTPGKKQQTASNGGIHGFVKYLVILTAAVMKADGKIVRGELDYVRAFFNQQFGEETTKQALLYLRDVLKQPLPTQQACIQIRTQVDYQTRVHILHYMFGLAQSEGAINESELRTIEILANYLGIAQTDFLSVKSAYIRSSRPQDTHWAYKILDIPPHASNEEVKKAYKRMAIKYHPDKSSHKGEKEQKAAEEQFKKINSAYEEIKRQRGMN